MTSLNGNAATIATVLDPGLVSHFEEMFGRILKDGAKLPRAELANALAQETAFWIGEYDEFLTENQG